MDMFMHIITIIRVICVIIFILNTCVDVYNNLGE